MSESPENTRVSRRAPEEKLSVSQLTRSVRDVLEHRFPLLWVSGEISNFLLARSGHAYFVLKDERAQVRCVMFRHRNQYLDWTPRDGMQVEVQGLVSLYEPRGDFQLTVETMRRAGRGALYEAFIRLKERLSAEGLFDEDAKRDLPAFPRAIGVVSSLAAAALRDVLTTLARRNPSIPVFVYPCPVQGAGAGAQIAGAIAAAGRRGECDVLIVARGGGSIEDLWAFNDEAVARAIRACPVPVVTGVGHETDFTIADFAADRRAPTPTAAAELVSPSRAAMLANLAELAGRLSWHMRRALETRMQRLDSTARRLQHPGKRLAARADMLAQLGTRLSAAARRDAAERAWGLERLVQRMRAASPDLREARIRTAHALQRLARAVAQQRQARDARMAATLASLGHLDPANVLSRGYSVVRDGTGRIIRDAASLSAGALIEARFASGGATARVEQVLPDDKAPPSSGATGRRPAG